MFTYVLRDLLRHVLAELSLLHFLLVVVELFLVGIALHDAVVLLHVLVVAVALSLEVVLVTRESILEGGRL